MRSNLIKRRWSWVSNLIKKPWICVVITVSASYYISDSYLFSELTSSGFGKKHAQTILFVHGFRGLVNASDFSQEMQELFGLIPDFQANVETWSWKSGGGVVPKDMPDWVMSNFIYVPKAAAALLKKITRYEEEGRAYYLIGYSLGTAVVAEALKKSSLELKMIKGIYFMGAAFPSDTKRKGIKLPEGIKITNFYSPDYDGILKKYYYHGSIVVEGSLQEAGGRVGFTDNSLFVNLKTDASHSPSDDKCHFLNMAPAIGYLIAKKEGYTIEDKPIKTDYCDLSSPAQNRWNNVYDLGDSMVQQNSCPETNNNFRIVDKSGKMLEQNCNLHTLMKGKW